MRMINKKIIAGFVFFVTLAVIVIVSMTNDQQYRVDVFEINDGWGYNILIDNKLIIHQPYVPAIRGQAVFWDKNSAVKTGYLVVKKLKKKQSPRITINELDSIMAHIK